MAKIVLLLAVSYTILVSVLSLVQLGQISVGGFNPTDKMMHTGAYFMLALLWLFYYFVVSPQKYFKGLLIISGGLIGFGILIEVLQGTFTSYREPDLLDILANTIGVLGALSLFVIFPNFINRVKQHINSFL